MSRSSSAHLVTRTRVGIAPALARVEGFSLLALALLILLALIVGPKLLLSRFVDTTLSGNLEGLDWLLVIAQDLLLFWLCAAALSWCLTRTSGRALAGLWTALALLVALLFIDLRVRQLWLKPLDWAVVAYFFEHATTLSSSSNLFFTSSEGLGMTFRRLLLVVFGLHLALGLCMWTLRARHHLALRALRRRRVQANWWLGAATIGAAALACPRQIYALEDTLLVTQAARAFATSPASEQAPRFEQPLLPAREVLAPPRVRLADVAPFRNVVLVVLESFRARGVELARSPLTPNLGRLAREGLAAKAYVSVPHSSKGLYAVLSGRAPSSGVAIREAASFHESSFVHDLRKQRGAATFAFSTPYLAFENTEGLLRAHGFETVLGGEQLDPRRGHARSSYGTGDEILASAPARILSEHTARPFACVILTTDAHHPYVFPGKRNVDGDGWSSYTRALEHTDRVIGDMLASFERAGLTEDTLFVFVSDHGESFGEHGSVVHNNSLYEEEITVPLVFWSADGRLKHAEPLEARQIDVAPTIADLMGLDAPSFTTQGVSLLRTSARPPAFASSFFEGVAQALVLDGQKYMFWPSSQRLVRFDLRADPHEARPQPVSGQDRAVILERFASARAYESRVWQARE